MSGRLDQTLDSIIDSQKKAKRNNPRRKAPRPAPVGGVKKAVKPNKSAVKTAASAAPRAPRNSKIVVSGLPLDVSESQIKVRRCLRRSKPANNGCGPQIPSEPESPFGV